MLTTRVSSSSELPAGLPGILLGVVEKHPLSAGSIRLPNLDSRRQVDRRADPSGGPANARTGARLVRNCSQTGVREPS